MRCTDPLEKNLDTLFLLYHSITEDEIEYTYLCILFFCLEFLFNNIFYMFNFITLLSLFYCMNQQYYINFINP